MLLLVIAFLSGILTVLAPCVLPLLPVILGASAEDKNSKKIPLIVITSLSVSILVFSLLLKASTLLIDVPASFWKSVSGGLLILLGMITIFPNIWKNIANKLWFSNGANSLLQSGSQKQGIWKYIWLGAALGPVFSSCSPTYSLILAIILPASFAFGLLALIFYILGLAFVLFLIAILGQKFLKNVKWISKPNGVFKKVLGVIFLLIGLAIISGVDKKIEAKILDVSFLNTTNFEQNIIDGLDLWNTEKKVEQPENNKDAKSWWQCKGGSCEKVLSWSLNFITPENILEKWKLTEKWYKAPDFSWLQNWINSDSIASLEDLKGKVVMIDFWTLGCINCINTHKETNKLYSEFKDTWFEIVGIHAPEFQYERNLSEVKKAVEKYNIEFPVVQDNDFTTWKLYNNRYWPAFYMIDKQWNVRYTHFGEGGYEKKREVIKELLTE